MTILDYSIFRHVFQHHRACHPRVYCFFFLENYMRFSYISASSQDQHDLLGQFLFIYIKLFQCKLLLFSTSRLSVRRLVSYCAFSPVFFYLFDGCPCLILLASQCCLSFVNISASLYGLFFEQPRSPYTCWLLMKKNKIIAIQYNSWNRSYICEMKINHQLTTNFQMCLIPWICNSVCDQ